MKRFLNDQIDNLPKIQALKRAQRILRFYLSKFKDKFN